MLHFLVFLWFHADRTSSHQTFFFFLNVASFFLISGWDRFILFCFVSFIFWDNFCLNSVSLFRDFSGQKWSAKLAFLLPPVYHLLRVFWPTRCRCVTFQFSLTHSSHFCGRFCLASVDFFYVCARAFSTAWRIFYFVYFGMLLCVFSMLSLLNPLRHVRFPPFSFRPHPFPPAPVLGTSAEKKFAGLSSSSVFARPPAHCEDLAAGESPTEDQFY